MSRSDVDARGIALRAGTARDVAALHRLIRTHLDEGRLLPRTRANLAEHASRFVVAARGATLLGCAELAPLSSSVAEVRSLVVAGPARGLGLARRLVDALVRRARLEGFTKVSAFAHDAGFFAHLGFQIVPHSAVPEKIARDCLGCDMYRRCGQEALVLALDRATAHPEPSANIDQVASGAY
jgi:amino-acid N-acetyltransferase